MATLFSKHNKLSDFWRLMLQYYLEILIFFNLLYFQYNATQIIISCFWNSLLQKRMGQFLDFRSPITTIYLYIFICI